MSTRRMSRNRQRFLDRLLSLLGISFRSGPAPLSIMEMLEPRTLMSIAPITPPFKVNTGESITNIHPQVASSTGGNFVVVWATGDSGEIRFRLFDSEANALTDDLGTGDFISDSLPAGGTNNPTVHSLNSQKFDVAMNASGAFVIAWQDSEDILAQRFTADGEADGDVINVSESGTDLSNETCPSIAMDNNGDFAVAWLLDTTVDVNIKTMTPSSSYQYWDDETNKVKTNSTPATTDVSVMPYATSIVQARRFDSENTSGDIITVSPDAVSSATTQTPTFTTNLNPGIAMDSAGDFAVAWNAIGYAPQTTIGMPAQSDSEQQEVYDSSLHHSKTVTLVTTNGATNYYNMGFSNVKSQVQRYNANGSAQTATPTPITKSPSASAGTIVGTDVKIVMDSAGDFAIVANTQYVKSKAITHNVDGANYTYSYYATSSAITMRRYNAAGVAQGSSETTIGSLGLTPFFSASPLDVDSAQLSNLTVAMDSTGNLIAAADVSEYDSDLMSMVGIGMYERRYNSTGTALEPAPSLITLNLGVAGSPGPNGESFPAVAFGTGGVIHVAWQQEGGEGSDVFTGEYQPVLPASKVVFTLSPDSTQAGPLGEVDVQVEDSNGFLVTDGSSTVTLSVFSGPTGAKLVGTVSAVTVNGVAVFNNLSLTRGGTYVLKATDGALTSATSSSFQIFTVPTQLAYTIQPKNGTAGQALSVVTVSVKDANGDVVTGDDSDVTLTIATGPGEEIDGTTTRHVVNGVATFDDLSLATAGTYTLLASDGELNNATSSKFIITAGAAANFSFTTEPISTTAGTKMTVKVTATDSSGNPALLDHTKLNLVIDEGPDGGTITSAVQATITNGVATFSNISFPKAGTYTLGAIHNAEEVTTSDEFTISAGAAAKLVFAHQPGNSTAGDDLDNVEVDVVDAFGNIVTNGSNVTLTVATSPKGSTAPTGTFTQSAGEEGAIFDDLVFTTAGGYSLKATLGKFTVTSNKFVISPDDMTQLVILTQPKPVVAGVAIKPAVTAALEDQFGNIDTTNTSTVFMAIHSGPDDADLFGNASANAVKGVVTFSNLILHTAGEYTLAATQEGLDDGVSNSFVVSPAKVASLEFLDQPSDVVAGHTMSTPTTVQLFDAFGNVATGDKSTVTLKIASGPVGAKLFGRFSVAAVNGVATFNALTLQTAGSYTLAATSGKLPGDTSSSFSVSASIATKMVFASVPGTVTASNAFGLQVKLLDAFGNLATDDSSTVTLSLGSTKPVGGALGGSLSIGVSDGVASFSGLTLSPKGKYTLKAVDSPLTLINSSVINVLAGAPV